MRAVSWIGLGAMGVRMAGRLLAAGHHLTVWNRTPERARPLLEVGARLAVTPADAVREADVVFMMLSDPAALRDVVEGAAGVAAGLARGAALIDMSTVGPAAIVRIAGLLPEGVTLVDAPVLGSLPEAETGDLTLLVGGPDQVVARLRPLLSQLGEPLHIGPVGTGATAKLVANFALLGTVGLLGEDLAVADGLGLPREVTWRILGHTPLAAQAERRRPTLEKGDFRARFALTMARKDADLVVAAADAAGVDVRFARAARGWLRDAEAAGLGGADYTAMLPHIVAGHRTANHAPVERVVSPANSPHYSWGDRCDGWRLVDAPDLSVIEEHLPPGATEQWHVHERARQFFHVLAGRATVRTESSEIDAHAGEGVEVPPGVPHQLANHAAETLRLLVITAPHSRGDRTPTLTPAREDK